MTCKPLLLLLALPVFIHAQDSVFTAEQAVQVAMQNNLQIQIAKSDSLIAAISNTWAFAGKWPTLSANISNTESIQNLNQELTTGSPIKRNGVSTNNLSASLNFSRSNASSALS